MADKVVEFIARGTVTRLEEYLSDPKISAVHELQRISGVGPQQAKLWISRGITSIEGVRKIKAELSHHQRIGLEHLEDFEKRIPREEAALLEAAVQTAIAKVDPSLTACAAGSYRRGAAFCGDVDVLIMSDQTRPSNRCILQQIVDALVVSGVVTDNISLGPRQYHGVARVPNSPCYRRLDLLLFTPAEYPCALLHFTGSGAFNRKMRFQALEAGLTLNEKGLFKGTAGDKGDAVECKSERDVFTAIGMEWVEPLERNMGK
eukprot:TRINITY_DN29882_c0_g1_i1.p1 TRINITY_DN29882_c0_g1~~TRINITY_DN29882_c0_g1_i1.p1  ORF type:complete len:261 (+),score=59.06 TRINITY_DN29882_c0_g1_i1:167-949(+)